MKLEECPSALPLTHVLMTIIRAGTGMLPLPSRVTICGILMVLASCVSMTAQNVVLTGSLGGRVTDSSGALVPG
ncbi:MAG: hypothetical protein WBV60_01475, partial [Terriglobales bacterium]